MSVFHEGELQAQRQAGVAEAAARVGTIIRPEISPQSARFLSERPYILLAGADAEGRIWASIVSGEPGFARAVNSKTLRIDALPGQGDPLRDSISPEAQLGILAIEPDTRRRIRVNGQVLDRDQRGFKLQIRESFDNCPRYIQARREDSAEPAAEPGAEVKVGERLSPEQIQWIQSADTFFIASAHPKAGADVSHRGGMPGFVRASGETSLAFPDYDGNNLLQAIGNITIDPRIGLLFIDFDTGSTLQLSGRAQIDWTPERAAQWNGAQRVIDIEVSRVVETSTALPIRWRFREYSPNNPPI